MRELIEKLSKNNATIEDFYPIINADFSNLYNIFYFIENIKKEYKKDKVKLCSIINAKSGKCPEDCAFCAQSAHYSTGVETFPLLSPEEIFNKAKFMEKAGARRFSIVTSGTAIKSKGDKASILKAIELITTRTNLKCCASLGNVTKDFLHDLKRAGLSGYHHNLETSKSFFTNICSTHNYQDDVNTVRNAIEIGLYVCSGGIFGLGEQWEHRIELAFTLKELDVDSLALNFLNPIQGTKLENANFLTPLDALKIVAIYRFIHPSRDIRICGGREFNLRDLQSFLIPAGANGLMIGNYLTTKGRDIKDDLQMLADLKVEIDNG